MPDIAEASPTAALSDIPIGIAATGERTETDSMGSVEVPADRYWGAQTPAQPDPFLDRRRPHAEARSTTPTAWSRRPRRWSTPRTAAWSAGRPTAIARAADEVDRRQARRHTSRCSSGRPAPARSRNMNVNEVISNRAIQLLGGELGSKTPGAPERRRQHGPVLQRHLPDGDAHRRRARSSTTACCRSSTRWRRRSRRRRRTGRTSSRSAAPIWRMRCR